jgi:hypothetical protein
MLEKSKNNCASTDRTPFSSSGYCPACRAEHTFTGPAGRDAVQSLIEELTRNRSLCPDSKDPLLATDALFGPARGKMFGVMTCRDADGRIRYLKAFSGQFNGLWLVDGWVPPLFDVDTWTHINSPAEQAIKRLGEEMRTCTDGSTVQKEIRTRRKALSRRLMKELHGLYRVTNFRGQSCSLSDIFPDKAGIPTGTGDCCAPKLFNFAAVNNLLPLGVSEFYWGRENRSGTRLHGHFYPPCMEKCRPILGFILCGLETEVHVRQ